jgi:hypothetical protein
MLVGSLKAGTPAAAHLENLLRTSGTLSELEVAVKCDGPTLRRLLGAVATNKAIFLLTISSWDGRDIEQWCASVKEALSANGKLAIVIDLPRTLHQTGPVQELLELYPNRAALKD